MLAVMPLPTRDSELVQIMDAAFADAAQRAGAWLACRPGCTQCCHGAFAINALDAARLQMGIAALRQSEPERAARIEARALSWIAAFGAEFPGDAATGVLGRTEAEREAFEEFANDAACPALDPETGLCDVYAWRPMTCRVFGPPVRVETGESGGGRDTALACCELCFVGADEATVAACEMHPPHELEEELLSQVREASGNEGEDETVVAFALMRPR
jgi:Fe-S-cluster containining protein